MHIPSSDGTNPLPLWGLLTPALHMPSEGHHQLAGGIRSPLTSRRWFHNLSAQLGGSLGHAASSPQDRDLGHLGMTAGVAEVRFWERADPAAASQQPGHKPSHPRGIALGHLLLERPYDITCTRG